MELSSEVLVGLKFLGDNHLTLQNFKRIIESVKNLILEEEQFERVGQICPEKREVVEQAYASILTFIIHAVQVNAPEEAIKDILSSCGFKEDRVQCVTSLITAHQNKIAAKLSQIKSLPPRVVDVNWKLQFVIKSSSKNHIGEAQFLLVLTTEKCGTIDHIRFTCDQYQLQDLSTKLKQIVHQAEKISTQ